MPCNGWQHDASCDCGWGGKWYGNSGRLAIYCHDDDPSAITAVSVHKSAEPGHARSVTIPNARCPAGCGASVFFYQNEYGSRVFFDSLGPPWPKHWCTDNSRFESPTYRVLAPTSSSPYRNRALAKEVEWRPWDIVRKFERSVILQELNGEDLICLEMPGDAITSALPIVFIKPISESTLTLSVFHGGVRSGTTRVVVFGKMTRQEFEAECAKADNKAVTPSSRFPRRRF